MATMHDVARRAGVSQATVSRSVRGHGVVAPDTHARVMSAIQQLGYQPDALAQGLRSGRGRTVALLISDIEQGINSVLTKHLQKALEEIGLDLLLYDLAHREDRLRSLLERAQSLRLRGVVIAATDVIRAGPIRQLVARLRSRGIAVIAINQALGRYGISSIVHEEAAAAALAVREFLHQGRSPIAFGRAHPRLGHRPRTVSGLPTGARERRCRRQPGLCLELLLSLQGRL
jgi:DNA-binding LacI/PurR family transcriptional regulator